MMQKILINGVELPEYPITFTPSIQDLHDAETSVRTADGNLNLTWIATKRKFDMAWGPLDAVKVSQILTMVKHSGFEMTYLDPESNYVETKRFYAGDRIIPHGVTISGKTIYIGLKFTVTEM